MPPKSIVPAALAAPAEETVTLRDGSRETLPSDAAEALKTAGAAADAVAEPQETILLLKAQGRFAAGRVITAPKSLADPLVAAGSARLATAAQVEIAWPHVDRVQTL